MSKNFTNHSRRSAEKAAIVAKTAEITGVSDRYVRYVIAGERENEAVLSTYMTLLEEFDKLPDAVRQLVPL
jgi:hypothetical protein